MDQTCLRMQGSEHRSGEAPGLERQGVTPMSASDEELWQPLRQGTVSQQIAQRILTLINTERLHPGDRLPSERDLAARLGVSRPSLREALKSLQAQGHVDIRHGTGVFVTEPASARTLRTQLQQLEIGLVEVYDMREVLEVPAAAWAAQRHDPAELTEIQRACKALIEASSEEPVDWDRLQRLDEQFHLRIVESAGNRFLSRTLSVLHDMLPMGMHTTLSIPGRLEQARKEHERILAAVTAGNASAARNAVRAHINGARKAALKRLRTERARQNQLVPPPSGR